MPIYIQGNITGRLKIVTDKLMIQSNEIVINITLLLEFMLDYKTYYKHVILKSSSSQRYCKGSDWLCATYSMIIIDNIQDLAPFMLRYSQ